jgi:iron complex transport system substrate-binding protein
MRIVSLLPSATETVFALGKGAELVGRSEECDHPAEVSDLPVVMRARTHDAGRSSREIDERVAARRDDPNGLYELDLTLLRSLAPDVILTQDLCRVCSVTDDQVREACLNAGVAPRIISVSPTLLGEVWQGVLEIGRAIGVESRASEWVARAEEEGVPPSRSAAPRPTVAVVEWLDPPILAGLWVPEMIELAGGSALGAVAGAPGRRVGWGDLKESAPDLVVLSPCSFSVARTRAEVAEATMAREIEALRPRLGTWIADEAHFSRPGPRLLRGIALLAALLAGGTPPDRSTCERYQVGWIGAPR